MPDYYPPPATLPPGSPVWAYTRDSGGDAQEQSVFQQQAEIESFCKRYNLVLVRTFTDIAKSGGSVAKRDRFLEMIDLSKIPDQRPSGLLVWNLARFSRDIDDSSLFKATLRINGLIIHSLTDPIPEGDYSRVVEVILEVVNQEKLRQTSRDVKRGLQAAFQEGYSFGVPPTGYLGEHHEVGKKRDGKPRIRGKWVPNLELWDYIKLAWQLRAEGKSYPEIREATHGLLFTCVNSWTTFFRNKAYLGIGIHGDLEIPNHHPAAIDRETWERVQAFQAKSYQPRTGLRHPRTMGTKTPSLLAGLAYCIHCGYSMVKTQEGKNKWDCYECNKKSSQGNRSCPNRAVNARAADQAVYDAVVNQAFTPEFIQGLVVETRLHLASPEDLNRDEQRFKQELAEIQKGINHLVDLVEKTGSQTAIERLREREIRKAALKTALQQVEAKRQAAQVDLSPEVITLSLEAWRKELITTRQAKDIRAMKNLLTRFVSKVELGYNHARIHFTYPIHSLYTVNSPLSYGGTNN